VQILLISSNPAMIIPYLHSICQVFICNILIYLWIVL
jgi:hypothetical protein